MHSMAQFLTIGSAIGEFRVGDMLATLFFFAVLLFLLKKFAWGPLMNVMEQREKHVADEIAKAEQNRRDAEEASKKMAAQLSNTKAEAQKIIEDARQAGAKQEQEIIDSAIREAERLKDEAQLEIQHEKEKAIQALQDQVASLSVLIASKVIEKELSEEDQDKLISDYLKDVGEEQ